MKRRDFSAICAVMGGATLAASALYAPSVVAQPKKPEPGTDYYVLDKRASVEAPRRKNRGGGVLLVQLSSLQCVRAHAGSLDQKCSQRCVRAPGAGRVP